MADATTVELPVEVRNMLNAHLAMNEKSGPGVSWDTTKPVMDLELSPTAKADLKEKEGLIELLPDHLRDYHKVMTTEQVKASLSKLQSEQRQLADENNAWARADLERKEAYRQQLKERWEKRMALEGYTPQEIRESGMQQTLRIFAESNLNPDHDVYVNAILSEDKRMKKAEQLLNIKITEARAKAISEAHATGTGTVHNFSETDINAKKAILRQLGPDDKPLFSETEIDVLMAKGIVGAPRQSADADVLEATPAAQQAARDDWNRVRADARARGKPLSIPHFKQEEAIRQGKTFEVYKAELKEERRMEGIYGKRIESFEDVVTEIVNHGDASLWGPQGKHPLYNYEMYTDAEGNERERMKLNFGNFRRWVLDRMWYYHADSPDDQHNYGQLVALLRPNGNAYSLNTMLHNMEQFFKVYDDDGTEHILDDLVEQIKRDMFMFTLPKNFDILYRKGGAQGSEDELAKLLNGLHADNPFTKPVWENKSIFYWMFIQPSDYITEYEHGKKDEKDKRHKHPVQDAEIGAASALAFLSYRNLTNIPKLVELLGEDAPLFDRAAFIKARNALAEKHNLRPDDFVSDEAINDAFKNVGEDGRLKLKNLDNVQNVGKLDKYSTFINIYANPQINKNLEKLVREMVSQSLINKLQLYNEVEGERRGKAEDWYVKDANGKMRKYDEEKHPSDATAKVFFLDTIASNYAEAQGYYNQRWTGGQALNDTKNTAFDAHSRWLDTVGYRLKQGTDERGGWRGNDFNLFMFQRLIADFLTGTRTEFQEYVRYEDTVVDKWGNRHAKGDIIYQVDPKTGKFLEREVPVIDPKTGKALKDPEGNVVTEKQKIPIKKMDADNKPLYKTPLQVIEEIAKIGEMTRIDPGFDPTPITQAIGDLKMDMKDPSRRGEWLRDVASQMIFPDNTQQKYAADHLMRGATIFKLLMSGHQLDFGKFVKKEFTSMGGIRTSMDTAAFGEAFQEKFLKPFRYGYSTWAQIDYTQRIPVWQDEKKDKSGKVTVPGHYEEKYLAEAMFGREILDAKEFWKTDERGKPIPHEIDVKKIQGKEGKVRLFKRMIMGYVAAQLYSHRTSVSREKKMSDQEYAEYFDNILDGLRRIPNGLAPWSEEFGDVDMKTIFPTEDFFTKEDIQWIREHSNTTNWQLFRSGFFWSFLRAMWGATKDVGKFAMKEFK